MKTLLEMRLEREWSRPFVAEKTGCSVAAVRLWELGNAFRENCMRRSRKNFCVTMRIVFSLKRETSACPRSGGDAERTDGHAGPPEADSCRVILAPSAWKECHEATTSLDPGIIADGIDSEERRRMRRECEEAKTAIERLLSVI